MFVAMHEQIKRLQNRSLRTVFTWKHLETSIFMALDEEIDTVDVSQCLLLASAIC